MTAKTHEEKNSKPVLTEEELENRAVDLVKHIKTRDVEIKKLSNEQNRDKNELRSIEGKLRTISIEKRLS